MSQQCPHCRLAVQDGDTFCGECGGALVVRLPGGRAGPAPRSRAPANQDTGPLDPPLGAWSAPSVAAPSPLSAVPPLSAVSPPTAVPAAAPPAPGPPGPAG